MSMCSRPTIETHTMRDRRTYAQCNGCWRISPIGQDEYGTWADAHRAEAAEANALIGERVSR